MASVGVVGVDEADPGSLVLENGAGKVVKENNGRLKKQQRSNSPGDDFVTATGTRFRAAGLTLNEADDTLSSAAALPIKATSTPAEAADTLAAAGALAIQAAIAATEADDSLAASGATPITGSLDAAEGDDTIAAEGILSTSLDLDVTEDDDALAADAVLAIVGALDASEDADTLEAAAALAIAGTLDVTEGDDTIAGASGLLIQGRLGAAEYLLEEADGYILTESGGRLVLTRFSGVEADDVLDAFGSAGSVGVVSAVEDDDALEAASELGEAPAPQPVFTHGGGRRPAPYWTPARKPILGRLFVREEDDVCEAAAALGLNTVEMDNDLLLIAA